MTPRMLKRSHMDTSHIETNDMDMSYKESGHHDASMASVPESEDDDDPVVKDNNKLSPIACDSAGHSR